MPEALRSIDSDYAAAIDIFLPLSRQKENTKMNTDELIRSRYVISEVFRPGPKRFRVQVYEANEVSPASDGLIFQSLDEARKVVPPGYEKSEAHQAIGPDVVEAWQ